MFIILVKYKIFETKNISKKINQEELSQNLAIDLQNHIKK